MRRTSYQIQGNGNGAIIMSVMSIVWVAFALHRLPIFWLTCALLPALLLIFWAVLLIRGSNRLRHSEPPLNPAEAAAERVAGKSFAWIFGGEGIAIFIVVNVLANLGKSAFLPAAIGIIVGLHFLLLARVFRFPIYYWTGGIEILLCVAAAVALRDHPESLITPIGGGMALTLWLTVVAVLLHAQKLLKHER